MNVTRSIARHLIPGPLVSWFLYIRDRAIVSPRAQVQFSPLVRFGKGTTVRPFVVVQTSRGRVTVGDNCAFNNFVHIAARDAPITVGNNVRVGPGVTILGMRSIVRDGSSLIIDQGYTDRGVQIGDDVLIGAHAVIAECTIGNGAVIGSGSVVTKDVEPYTIVAGIPARPIGRRE